MRPSRFRLLVVLLLGLLPAFACSLPFGAPTGPPPEAIYTAAAQTIVAQLTQAAQAVATLLPPTPEASPIPTLTPTPEIPTTTPTPTNTPLPPTPSVPMITASVNTNCRAGPSKVFDILGVIRTTDRVEVRGRLANNSWWYIQNPDNPSRSCWVWEQTTHVEGNIASIPVVEPPPTPTPTQMPDFEASFDNVHDCAGIPHATFELDNTGTMDFESFYLKLFDRDTDTTLFEGSSDVPFMGSGGECPIGGSKFPVGSVRYVAGPLGTPAPTGHKVRATIELCTKDALKDRCIERTVNFTVP